MQCQWEIHYFTRVDRFSKASHFLILLKLPNAFETGNLLFSHIFRIHGIRTNLVHQSNGEAERANQVLESALCCVAATKPSSWSKHLPLSPFEVSLSYQSSCSQNRNGKLWFLQSRSSLIRPRRCREVLGWPSCAPTSTLPSTIATQPPPINWVSQFGCPPDRFNLSYCKLIKCTFKNLCKEPISHSRLRCCAEYQH